MIQTLWIFLALVVSGGVGWPVTSMVLHIARSIDDKDDAGQVAEEDITDPAADVTVDLPPRADGRVIPGHVDSEPASPSGVRITTTRILRGGAIIGILERLGVCLAILTGQPVAIAYIVAIKGLGRFAELKETPAAAERFIIGTLASMLWAAGTAALIRVLFLT